MQDYERLCQLEIAPTLELLQNAFRTRSRRSLIAGQQVNTKSVRLQTFAFKGTICAHCGLNATHFALERNDGVGKDGPYHLNLWGENAEGERVLFTHDHIVPKARGGKDELANTQPMCSPCNWKKKSQMEWELEVPDGQYVSCEGETNPRYPGFYEAAVTGCRTTLPMYLQFDGKAWVGLAEFKQENGGGEVRWIKGSKPMASPPEFINPFAPVTPKP